MQRRALITGAAAGLAAGIASTLAGEGFERVAITYRSTPPDATLAAIRKAGAQAAAVRIDFGSGARAIETELARLVDAEGPFDTLVHAVGPLVVRRFARTTIEDYDEMFDGNVRSAVLAARAVLPSMRQSGFGRIVFFAMIGSNETRPYRGFSLYQAAKSAITAFARVLAMEEAGNGITVNVVAPGDIRQKSIKRAQARGLQGRNPRGRPGSYEDVADAVRFFVDPERDFVTGSFMEVSGGLSQADERNEPAP